MGKSLMIKRIFFVSIVLLFLVYTPGSFGQVEEEALPIHTDEMGINFSLAMSGLGFGGFYRKAFGSYTYIGANLNFFIMRDDKEYEYYDPYFGTSLKANNVNRLFFIPFNLELKKRLFANDIEDSFRPHFIIQGGIIYGMNYPRAEGLKNEHQFSYDFVLGVGADITNRDKYFVTIRPQYRFVYFAKEIAQKKNHSSFEIKLEFGGRLF